MIEFISLLSEWFFCCLLFLPEKPKRSQRDDRETTKRRRRSSSSSVDNTGPITDIVATKRHFSSGSGNFQRLFTNKLRYLIAARRGRGTTMSIPSDELPIEVLQLIASYVADPISVCRMSLSCPAFAEAVTSSEGLWDRLYRKRWTFRMSTSTTYTRDQYKAKHLDDRRVLRKLVEAAQEVRHEQDFAVGTRYQGAAWKALLRETESFNLFRLLAKNEPEIKTLYNFDTSPLMQCLARYLMDFVHFTNILKSFDLLLTTHDATDDPYDLVFLEQGALLITQSIWTYQGLLIIAIEAHLSVLQEKLDDLGRRLRLRMVEQSVVGDSVESTIQAISLVEQLLNDEVVYNGSTIPAHAVQKFSLEYALRTGRGAAVIKAVLYQIILRRANVSIQVFASGALTYLRIPGTNVFVDILVGRGRLPAEEVQEMLSSHGLGRNPASRTSREQLFRILHQSNLARVQYNLMYPAPNRNLDYAAAKSSTLLELFGQDRRVRRMTIRSWEEGHSLVFDPTFFLTYNVISEKTAMRYLA